LVKVLIYIKMLFIFSNANADANAIAIAIAIAVIVLTVMSSFIAKVSKYLTPFKQQPSNQDSILGLEL